MDADGITEVLGALSKRPDDAARESLHHLGVCTVRGVAAMVDAERGDALALLGGRPHFFAASAGAAWAAIVWAWAAIVSFFFWLSRPAV